MAKKITGIVQPTRKLTGEQIASQLHLAHRAGADVNRFREARKGKGRGGRAGGRRAAIASGW